MKTYWTLIIIFIALCSFCLYKLETAPYPIEREVRYVANDYVYITQKSGLTHKCLLTPRGMEDCEQVIGEIWK